MEPSAKTLRGAGAPQAPAPWAEHPSLFSSLPCRSCPEPITPHWLANYVPPVWVAAHGPKCGAPVYAESREALANDLPQVCACGATFQAPYWSDREKCDACLLNPKEPQR
jgi:hypothetical protein